MNSDRVFRGTSNRDNDQNHTLRNGVEMTTPKTRTLPVATLYQTLAPTLFFLDVIGEAVFLPVLPAIVQGVRYEKEFSSRYASVAAWVGFLAGAYYLGKLVAAQLRKLGCWGATTASPDGASPSFLVGMGVMLVLSAGIYVAAGLLIAKDVSLWWLAALRLLSGAVAAAHRILAFRCQEILPIEQYSLGNHQQEQAKPQQQRESLATMTGLVVGCTVSGVLFASGQTRPALRLCLVAAGAHTPSIVILFIIVRRHRSSQIRREASGGWSALASSDFESGHHVSSRHAESRHAAVQRKSGAESEAKVELTDRQLASGAADRNVDNKRTTMRPTNVSLGVIPGNASAVPVPIIPGGGGRLAATGGDLGESGEEDFIVPERYLRGCKGDPVEAERRWRLTLEWRAKERVDEVLREPQPHFDVIKQHYPHFVHRRARNGCPVWVELPGRINLPAIRSGGVSTEALRRHYVFVTEYLWGVVETDFDRGQAVTVLDVQGLGMRDLAGEALGFVKQATAIVQDHYVERSNRMFIINAPSYFSMIWRMIRPMLHERTQAKIAIINTDKAKIAEALLECIPPENLPVQYGGTCSLELGESEEEQRLRAYVSSITPSTGAEQEDEVEVDFHDHFVGSVIESHSKSGEKPPDLEREEKNSQQRSLSGDSSGESGRIDAIDDGDSSANRQGGARRMLGRVGGALGRAGSMFSWRRPSAPPVAHLGEENAFVYDEDLKRWVMKGEPAGGRGSEAHCEKDVVYSAGKRGSAEGPSGREGERSTVRCQREASMGSNTSEEMTVLAIQAAHFSLNEAATMKLSPAPSSTSPSPAGVAPSRIGSQDPHGEHDASRRLSNNSNASAENGALISRGHGSLYDIHDGESVYDGGDMVLTCSCCTRAPFEHGNRCHQFCDSASSHLPSFVSLCYSVSIAARESVPVWALAGSQAGGLSAAIVDGLGAAPSLVGVSLAAGVLVAEAAQAIASAGWLDPLSRSSGRSKQEAGQAGWGTKRILNAVRGRFVTVIVLGLLYTISRVFRSSLGTIPSPVIWLAVIAVVASNHIVLRRCRMLTSRRRMTFSKVGAADERHSHALSDNKSGDKHAERISRMSRSFAVGNVLGSAGGPLFLALVLSSGWPSPFDSSMWLLLSLCLDLWLILGAQPGESVSAHQIAEL